MYSLHIYFLSTDAREMDFESMSSDFLIVRCLLSACNLECAKNGCSFNYSEFPTHVIISTDQSDCSIYQS